MRSLLVVWLLSVEVELDVVVELEVDVVVLGFLATPGKLSPSIAQGFSGLPPRNPDVPERTHSIFHCMHLATLRRWGC